LHSPLLQNEQQPHKHIEDCHSNRYALQRATTPGRNSQLTPLAYPSGTLAASTTILLYPLDPTFRPIFPYANTISSSNVPPTCHAPSTPEEEHSYPAPMPWELPILLVIETSWLERKGQRRDSTGRKEGIVKCKGRRRKGRRKGRRRRRRG
jgi:hypothetical protein